MWVPASKATHLICAEGSQIEDVVGIVGAGTLSDRGNRSHLVLGNAKCPPVGEMGETVKSTSVWGSKPLADEIVGVCE